MVDSKYENYLHDLGILVMEMALQAKLRKTTSTSTKDEEFATGYLMAFHRVVSLMQQQAEVFHIPFEKIGLKDIDADVDLVV